MPEVDTDRCIECGACERACPVLHPPRLDRSAAPRVYACWNLDEAVRRESASGGMFSVFAEHVLRQAGVVFGAAFDGEMNLQHEGVCRRKDLARLRSSKYLQSRQGHAFREVRRLLQGFTLVLFVGTPCRWPGCMDSGRFAEDRQFEHATWFVSGGTGVFAVHSRRGGEVSFAVRGINFRHKRSGLAAPSVQVTFEVGRQRFSLEATPLQERFWENISCDDVAFIALFNPSRISDITWAISGRSATSRFHMTWTRAFRWSCHKRAARRRLMNAAILSPRRERSRKQGQRRRRMILGSTDQATA